MKIANSKDVKKALNCCIKREKSKEFCKDCPYEDNCRYNRLEKDILTVIEVWEKDNEELQSLCNKTYDDLTKEIDRIKAENERLKINIENEKKWGKIQLNQAEKDKAREILNELDLFFKGTTFRKGYEFKKIEEKLKELEKNHDVEVDYEN